MKEIKKFIKKIKMEKINKEDFEILFQIEFMNFNNPNLLSNQLDISETEAKNKLIDFKEKGLINLEIRDDKIYGSQFTEKGKELWNDEKYNDWKEEFGY